jgi:hypothetical protein
MKRLGNLSKFFYHKAKKITSVEENFPENEIQELIADLC